MVGARAVVALVVWAMATEARALPCDESAGPGGPLPLAPGPADLGQPLAPCPETGAMLRLRSEILIDRTDFYGALAVTSTVAGQVRLTPRWALMAALDVLRYRFAANAVVQSSGLGAGPATVGGSWSFAGERGAMTGYARALLPFDSARHHGALWGGELGVVGGRAGPGAVTLRGGVSLPGTLALVAGTAHAELRSGALAELAWAPWPWLAVAGGLDLRSALAPRAEVLAFALRPSLRFWPRGRFYLAVGADIPVAGVERTDLVLTLLAGL